MYKLKNINILQDVFLTQFVYSGILASVYIFFFMKRSLLSPCEVSNMLIDLLYVYEKRKYSNFKF